MLRRRRMLPLVTLALVAIPLFVLGGRVLAVEDEENKVLFGPVGLAPGVIGSVDLVVEDPDFVPGTRLSRRTVRAEIVGVDPLPEPPSRWAATLEVVDGVTGRTSLFIGNPDVRPERSAP